ncbi:MAG: hypothetical protein LBE23_12735, partial [Vagococcus sp.]|nr:hypothetical protein [Vagococcus sp.]
RPEGLYFFIYFGNFIKNNDKIPKNKPITLYEQLVCLQSEMFHVKHFNLLHKKENWHLYERN